MSPPEQTKEIPLLSIRYEKYLNCPMCKEREYYCNKHKIEVEKILQTSLGGW